MSLDLAVLLAQSRLHLALALTSMLATFPLSPEVLVLAVLVTSL
jgi:hypothetical protein